MEFFVYLAFSTAVFLQFMPPQLCKEIKGFEIVHKNKDGLVESRIGINFATNEQVKSDVDSIPISRILPQSRINNSSMKCTEHFCENVPNYPMDEINFALKNLSIKASSTIQGDASMLGINNRQDTSEGTGLCEPTRQILRPQLGINMDNVEKYIVNSVLVKQEVVVTSCGDNRGKTCGKAILYNTFARCQRDYSLVRLLSYHVETSPLVDNVHGPLSYDLFPYPSCCVCKVRTRTGPRP